MSVSARWTAFALVLLGLIVLLPRVARAQQGDTAALRRAAEQRLGRPISQAEIVDRLRQSGLTRTEIRARLSQLGYDPNLADRYYDVIEGGAAPPRGEAPGGVLEALQRLGVYARSPVPDSALAGDAAALQGLAADTLSVAPTAPGDLPVFGRSLFERATTQFQPVLVGPVDPGYRLGPGDEIALILTGDVELAYTLDVTREGYVVIPNVGQMFVNGLTLRDLEDRLYSRLGRVYSGVQRGPGATVHFQVSLGRLRTNLVYIIGEVQRPGAYQVSAAATAFNALYQAGGPSVNGSFRQIEVRRGNKTVRAIDVYDYLLRGDNANDIRLEQADLIFVPVAGRRVRILGAVRRPGIYELVKTDGLRQLLHYAGGFEPEALVRRVQIDRILPPEGRRPGVDRVLIDVDIAQLGQGSQESVPLQDGDIIQVFDVSKVRRHRLVVTGEVRRPGIYEWVDGSTLWSLILRADGLDEPAYLARAHIYRLNRDDFTRRLIRTPLLSDSAGRPLTDVPLEDRDSVIVFSRASLTTAQVVTIHGFVKKPGTYALAEGMTLQDLILAAGGFLFGAYQLEAEVAQLPDPVQRSDTTARVFRVRLDDTDRKGANGGDAYGGAADVAAARRPANYAQIPEWVPTAQEFLLQHGDQVFIRKGPGYEGARTVIISGEVMLPGKYMLRTRDERLLDLIARAGGLTPQAFTPGLRLVRLDRLLATNHEGAVKDPNGRYNLFLEPGDSISIPRYDPTVLVEGQVTFEARVLFQPGASLDYYVNRAGGYTDSADRKRVSVEYPNGERATVDRLLFFKLRPEVAPGSRIFVPMLPQAERKQFDWDQFIARTLAILSTTATLLIAVNQLNK